MMDDIEDVYDAVNWLRRHGIEINNNKEGVSNYDKKKPYSVQTGDPKRHRQHKVTT